MSIRINGHGVAAVVAIAFLWYPLVAMGDIPREVLIYFGAASVVYGFLIVTNVDDQVRKAGADDRADTAFRRQRAAWGAHLFLVLAVAAMRTGFTFRVGLIWAFVLALTLGLSIPFVLVRRVVTQEVAR